MTNDYMFRAVLQRNETVLRGLLAALLGLDPNEIQSVRIENPIKLGESIQDKTIILDILLTLNDNSRINIEMQVSNEHNWKERALTYVCRLFDDLNHGEDYHNVKPVIHIGILDFDLFPEETTFYSRNVFMDTKTFRIFSSKIQLNVLSLGKVGRATKEDKARRLDYWAKLFRATTWEELRRLAKKSEVFKAMIVTMAELTADEKIRIQCEAREIYNKRERTWQVVLDEEKAKVKKAEAQISDLTSENATLASQNSDLASQNSDLTSQNADLTSQNADLVLQVSDLAAENAALKAALKKQSSAD